MTRRVAGAVKVAISLRWAGWDPGQAPGEMAAGRRLCVPDPCSVVSSPLPPFLFSSLRLLHPILLPTPTLKIKAVGGFSGGENRREAGRNSSSWQSHFPPATGGQPRRARFEQLKSRHCDGSAANWLSLAAFRNVSPFLQSLPLCPSQL